MSIEKKYLKTKPVCKVTFIAPKQITDQAGSVFLAGEFNDWEFGTTKLKKQKNGVYSITLSLIPGKEYQYRYVINGKHWENDFCADKYVPSMVCEAENSVVLV